MLRRGERAEGAHRHRLGDHRDANSARVCDQRRVTCRLVEVELFEGKKEGNHYWNLSGSGGHSQAVRELTQKNETRNHIQSARRDVELKYQYQGAMWIKSTARASSVDKKRSGAAILFLFK